MTEKCLYQSCLHIIAESSMKKLLCLIIRESSWWEAFFLHVEKMFFWNQYIVFNKYAYQNW